MRETTMAADASAVRTIVRSSGFFSPDEVEVAVELVEERLAKGAASGYHFLFADTTNGTVGYTCFGPIPCTVSSFDLYWIAVLESCRGEGLGRELLLASEGAIARMGGRRVYIETSCRPQYVSTRAFYQSLGYAEAALLEDFYAPGDSKAIYVKVLG